jgi:hypothetical protein
MDEGRAAFAAEQHDKDQRGGTMKNETTRDAKIIRQCLRRIERNEAALASATGTERGRLEKMICTDRGRVERAKQRMEAYLPGYPRAETIKCPECGKVQSAQVHFKGWMPFPAYGHDCESCGYTIIESEWERVPDAANEPRSDSK